VNVRLEVTPGDITRQDVDVIVNAANATLLGGGGVDGAIHAAAGPQLLQECRRLRNTTHRAGLGVGEAVATGAGRLPARWVVHTVGPNRHRGQTDPRLLASCFTESLRVASSLQARSLAFPAISAGAYGWDVVEVARIAVDAVRSAVAVGAAECIDLVRFIPFGPTATTAFHQALGTPPP
jgi:O-acetyl-ADP-ribose deacetylase (regulator of RNase III)